MPRWGGWVTPPLNADVRREQHDATCRLVGFGTPSGLLRSAANSSARRWFARSGDVYQFGVASGRSLRKLGARKLGPVRLATPVLSWHRPGYRGETDQPLSWP